MTWSNPQRGRPRCGSGVDGWSPPRSTDPSAGPGVATVGRHPRRTRSPRRAARVRTTAAARSGEQRSGERERPEATARPSVRPRAAPAAQGRQRAATEPPVPPARGGAEAAAQATKGSGIPVVFIAVSDGVGAGLMREIGQATGTNITGVYSADPVEQQMDLIREIQPSARRLGIIFNAGEANSVSNVQRIKTYLEGKMEIVEATAASSNEVQLVAQSLAGRVDAVFMPQDNTVMSAVDALIRVCQEQDLPLYTGDTESVKKGALATLGNDEYDCGRQGAVLVARILRGEEAGTIVPEEIRKRTLLINQGAAEKYGITIPQAVLERADEVIEQGIYK